MRLKSVGMGYFLAIPDAISLLNLVFGFLAILMVIDNHLDYAAVCILLAVVFDSIDGWVARKLNRKDSLGFGKNIDSLADIVSFGVAPSVLLYHFGSNISGWGGYLIAIVAIFTLVCGILRLTRYNVISDKINYHGFIGFPIPGTAIILATYYLSGLFNIIVASFLMLFAGYLMISTIRYPKLDNKYVISVGALMILLLILPIKLVINGINLPALILFILSLVYMFMTFLEFFSNVDATFDKDNANIKVNQVKHITTNKVSNSLNSAKDTFNSLRDTLNHISSDNFEETKDIDNQVNSDKYDISNGEVED